MTFYLIPCKADPDNITQADLDNAVSLNTISAEEITIPPVRYGTDGMPKKYSLRPGHVTIGWLPLSPDILSMPHYGNRARYVQMGCRYPPRPMSYLRNPHAKPLLHNGKKPR